MIVCQRGPKAAAKGMFVSCRMLTGDDAWRRGWVHGKTDGRLPVGQKSLSVVCTWRRVDPGVRVHCLAVRRWNSS